MAIKSLDQHIEVTPEIAGGIPRISGNGVPVRVIAHDYMYLGKGAAEIASEYNLTQGDVHAALAFYLDHQDDFDFTAEVEENSRMNDSLVRRFWQGVGSVLEFFPSPRRFDQWRNRS